METEKFIGKLTYNDYKWVIKEKTSDGYIILRMYKHMVSHGLMYAERVIMAESFLKPPANAGKLNKFQR